MLEYATVLKGVAISVKHDGLQAKLHSTFCMQPLVVHALSMMTAAPMFGHDCMPSQPYVCTLQVNAQHFRPAVCRPLLSREAQGNVLLREASPEKPRCVSAMLLQAQQPPSCHSKLLCHTFSCQRRSGTIRMLSSLKWMMLHSMVCSLVP